MGIARRGRLTTLIEASDQITGTRCEWLVAGERASTEGHFVKHWHSRIRMPSWPPACRL